MNLLNSISKRLMLIFTISALVLFVMINSSFANELSATSIVETYSIWFGLLFVIIEYILGKTTLVKSGSTLELVINTVVSILKKLVNPKSSLRMK